MKNWAVASMEELNLGATAYGGNVVNEFDNVYQNAEGNWEGTFEPKQS